MLSVSLDFFLASFLSNLNLMPTENFMNYSDDVCAIEDLPQPQRVKADSEFNCICVSFQCVVFLGLYFLLEL